ncbi:MAG TPA: hypothetical protein DCM08_06245 [Microscillaceae bacterium]|jgi:CrcB protein|nr:hypothetical protein [Microscillaceae bacterium]
MDGWALWGVFVGGGLGSVVRFAVARWAQTYLVAHFPIATLAVNVAGCLLLGCLSAWLSQQPDRVQAAYWQAWLGVGFCGGLTTFSTFAAELYALRAAAWLPWQYLLASLVLGVGAFAMGTLLTKGGLSGW